MNHYFKFDEPKLQVRWTAGLTLGVGVRFEESP
jgi:hypothetical protein